MSARMDTVTALVDNPTRLWLILAGAGVGATRAPMLEGNVRLAAPWEDPSRCLIPATQLRVGMIVQHQNDLWP